MKNSGGNEVEFEFFAFCDNSVSCIVTSGKSNDKAGLASQNVNEFSFCFIAPLGAYDHKCWHNLAHPGAAILTKS